MTLLHFIQCQLLVCILICFVGLRLLQVMPAFKKRKVATHDPIEDRLSGVSELLGEPTQRSEAARCSRVAFDSDVISCPKKESVHQYQILRAIDHSLGLSGLGGLAAFRPSTNYCRLLSPTEVRYMHNDCSPWADYTADVWQRVCVKDMRTGEKRFEVATDATERGGPLLALFLDEHGVQLSMLQKTLCRLNLRILWFRDPFHRYWRDLLMALQEANLWTDILERMHIMNIPTGPWKSARWWRDITDALAEHFSKYDHCNPLFRAMLPELSAEARSNGFGTDTPEGSRASERSAWLYLRSASVLNRKGFKVKTKTWFEVINRMHAHNKEYYAWLYALCVLCKAQGHFKTLADMPVFGADLPPALVSVLPGDALANAKSKAGAAGQKLRSLHARCANACVVAALCQGQRSAMHRSRLIVHIARPVWTCFAKEISGLTSEGGVLMRYCAYAQTGQTYIAARIWASLRDNGFLELFAPDDDVETSACDLRAHAKQRLSLSRLTEVVAAGGGARPPAQIPLEVLFLNRNAAAAELASLAWSFARSLVKYRSLANSHYADIPPGQFAALLSPTQAAVRAALAEQKSNWETLLAVEKRMHLGAGRGCPVPALLKVVRAIGFLHHDVPREVLAALAQHDFRIVPPGIKSSLETCFRGIGSSRPNEKAFNATKDWGRRNKDFRRISRMNRHYVPSALRVLKDQFSRNELELGNAGLHSTQQSVPPADFDALDGEPSLPDGLLLEAMKPASVKFPCTNAQGLHCQVPAWRLLRCCANGTCPWASVSEAWQSQLLPVGGVARKECDGSVHVVLATHDHGALLWPADEFVEQGVACFRPALSEAAKASWCHIVDPYGWRACLVTPLPPDEMRLWFPTAAAATVPVGPLGSHIGLLARSPMQDLWNIAAYEGFPSFTSDTLDLAIKKHCINDGVASSDRPKLVLAKVEALIRWSLPKIKDADIANIIRRRAGLTERGRPSLLLTGSVLAKCDGSLARSDASEALEFKRDQLDPQVSMRAAAAHWLRGKGWMSDGEFAAFEKNERDRSGAREDRDVGAPRPEPPAHLLSRRKIEFYVERWVRDNCLPDPKPTGCTIQHNVDVHRTSWTARYPGVSPASKTRHYKDGGSTSEQACDLVMAWLWHQHQTKHPGADCPWDFGGGDA